MLGVEGLVDLIEQVERSGVTLLDGKNQGQSYQRLLTSRQLLHLSHLTLLPCERHLHRTGEVALFDPRQKHTEECAIFMVSFQSILFFAMFLCFYDSSDNDSDRFRVKTIGYYSTHESTSLWYCFVGLDQVSNDMDSRNTHTFPGKNSHTLGEYRV